MVDERKVSIEELRANAERGDVQAQHELAYALSNGEGVEKDIEQALAWMRRAAEQGHSVAQHNIATAYFNGEGLEQDFAKAAEWYLKSAEQGCAEAQFSISLAYYLAQGVAQDVKLAGKWFRKGADQWYSPAMTALGVWYFDRLRESDGTNKGYQLEAERWLERSARRGDALAVDIQKLMRRYLIEQFFKKLWCAIKHFASERTRRKTGA